MIIVVGGIKGGSGKTTIATNLAICRAMESSDVLLVDADEQETSSDFSVLRDELAGNNIKYTCIKLSGKGVRTEVLKQVEKYDDIIIDTGGRDTSSQRAALTIADCLLVPFVPRSFDIWTLNAVSEIIKEIKIINPDLKAYTFLNRADSRGSDNEDAIEYIKESNQLNYLDVIISQRKVFGNASSEGKGILEYKPLDTKAIDEFRSLYNKIFFLDENFIEKE
jgi:chromosome partitioning protein